MNIRTENTDAKKYALHIFKIYSDTVYSDDYKNLYQFYDNDAVLVEQGKESFHGAVAIIDAIRAYHAGLGPSKTENYDYNIEVTPTLIIISCKYRVQSLLDSRTLEGDYTQYWKSEIGKMPKIIRDEFSIDKSY